ASAVSPALGEPNFHRAMLELREQFEELRRCLDDLKQKGEEREGPNKNVHTGVQEPYKSRPQAHASTEYPITAHCTPAITNDADFPFQSGSSSVGAGPSSRSYTGPFTLQTAPSTSFNDPPDGRPSSSMQYNSDLVQEEEQANENRTNTTLNDPTSYAAHPQIDPHNGDIKAGPSPAPTAADVVDLQRLILQLQEQNEQFRQQLDDSKQKAEAERYILEKEVAELRSFSHVSHTPQEHHLSTGTDHPLTIYCTQPSCCNSIAGAFTHLPGPSTISKLHPEGHRSSSAPHTQDFNISRTFTDYTKYQILLFRIFRMRIFEMSGINFKFSLPFWHFMAMKM
ncbi:hypothetical protein PAXRUDRAFT_145732, partial [Paxillus rubicundulus Ve08.2h10]